MYVGGGRRYSVASNPGFLFWILSCSFGEKSEGKSCKLFHVSGNTQPHAGESLARGIIYVLATCFIHENFASKYFHCHSVLQKNFT